MRVLRMGALVLMVLFLIIGRAYAQSVEGYCVKGVEYGAQGKFEEAEKEFKKALEIDQSYESAKESLKLIKDVLEKRVENEVAIYLKGYFMTANGCLLKQSLTITTNNCGLT